MKKLLTFCALAGIAFAQNMDHKAKASLEERVSRLEMESQRGTYGANTASGRQMTDCGFLLSFDVLYWHSKTDYTEPGGTKARTGTNQYNAGRSTYMDFDWEFGFKAGVGYHFGTREWDLLVQYTRVEFSDSLDTNPGALREMHPNFGEAVVDNASLPTMHASHKIDYQTVTATLGREFFVQSYLALTPIFGAKAAWINQHPHVTTKLATTAGANLGDQHTDITEKTVGVGPLAMMKSNWFLFKGWSFYADGGLSLLFTKYRGRMSVEDRVNDGALDATYRESNKEEKHYVTPNLFINMGLAYDHHFECADQNVNFSIGYESQYYINQSYLMQNRRVQDAGTYQGAWFARNLAVYGLTVSASYEF